MASNSRPSSSICSGVRWASGFAPACGKLALPAAAAPWERAACGTDVAAGPASVRGVPAVAVVVRVGGAVAVAVMRGSFRRSELDLDRALGRVYASADDLPGRDVDASGAQVAHAACAQAPRAAVADAHAAAMRHGC